jgi:hypothetical protein
MDRQTLRLLAGVRRLVALEGERSAEGALSQSLRAERVFVGCVGEYGERRDASYRCCRCADSR